MPKVWVVEGIHNNDTFIIGVYPSETEATMAALRDAVSTILTNCDLPKEMDEPIARQDAPRVHLAMCNAVLQQKWGVRYKVSETDYCPNK